MSEILFADTDSASVENAVLTAYETIAQTTLYPGDPVRLFLEALAYTLALQSNIINLAGRQNLLACAQGEHLDYLGMMVGTARLGASCAVARQRFSLSEELAFDVTIPAGTHVTTADGAAVFATAAAAVIRTGQNSVEVAVTAANPGAQANGLVPGQINRLIEPLAYIAATANVTASLLGADVETDERYRARIQLAPEAYTCAGSEGSYRHHALTAHQDIAEVAVWCPTPGTVDVRPVLSGGELPTETVLEAVRHALSAEDVRPLTDTVTVQAPEPVEYAVYGGWYLHRNNAALVSSVTQKIEATLEEYRLWQRSAPGRDINPTRLVAMLERAGAKRVELSSPTYRKLEKKQIARETAIILNFMGVEDD